MISIPISTLVLPCRAFVPPALYLGCLYGNFGQEVPSETSCNMVNGQSRVDSGRVPPIDHVPQPISSVASTSAAMAGKAICPAINSLTATSSAALSTVGAAPPVSIARRAKSSAGKRSRSGASKVSCLQGRQVKPCRRAIDAPRPGQAMRDRNSHVGGSELRHHRAVAKFHQVRAPPIADARARQFHST